MSNAQQPAVYSPNRILIEFGGVGISKGTGASGYGEDEFCKITQDGPSYTYRKGADGSVAREETNEPVTIVRITLMNSSKGNAVFSGFWNQDTQSPNGAGITTLVIKDLNGTSLYEWMCAWVAVPPEKTFGKTVKECVWELHCTAQTVRVDGGN